MKDDGVQLVIPCIDYNRRGQSQEGDAESRVSTPPMVLPNGNFEALKKNAEFLDGSYVLTLFVPLETRPKPEGVKLFEQWMKKTKGEVTENAIVGWINADLFVTGVKAVDASVPEEGIEHDQPGRLPAKACSTPHSSASQTTSKTIPANPLSNRSNCSSRTIGCCRSGPKVPWCQGSVGARSRISTIRYEGRRQPFRDR